MTRARPRGSGVGRRKGSSRAGAVALGVLAAAVAVAAALVWSTLYRPVVAVERGEPVQVEVPKGASTREIGEALADAGVVPNATMFRLQTRLMDADGALRAGVYDLATGMPYDLVIQKLESGPPVTYVTVTIPEGWVIGQIASRLEEVAGIPEEEFSKLARVGAKEFAAEHPYLRDAYKGSLEGYLFPKTYRFREGTTAREAIDVMLGQFDKEIAQVDTTGVEKAGFSLSQIVTVASIIEREARIPSERPLVSSVIYNRLERGMRLQMCATVEYVLPGSRLRLTTRETRTPSPYNTYLHKGLTPGPISNPGLASLKAAASPADTEFIFYVLTGKDGSQTYASNAADFERAKRKSKEVFGE